MECILTLFIPFLLLLIGVGNCDNSKEPLRPVVIVPGFLGSTIHADGEDVKISARTCKKNFYGDTMWLKPIPFLAKFECIRYYTSSRFENGKWIPKEGVKKYIRSYNSTKPVEKIGPKGVFERMVEVFKERGYVVRKNLFASAYDWTELPSEEWLDNTKNLIEKAVHDNGEKKAVLIAHSMGCPFSYIFLKEMFKRDKNWIDTFIYKYIPIAPAWAGSPVALKEMLNAEFLKEFINPIIVSYLKKIFGVKTSPLSYRALRNTSINDQDGGVIFTNLDNSELSMWIRHLPTAWALLPWEEAYGDKVLAFNTETGEDFRYYQLLPFLKRVAADNNEVEEMLRESLIKFKNTIDGYRWIPVNLPIRIIYGHGIKTPNCLKAKKWEKHDFEDKNSLWDFDVTNTKDGDGTVPTESLSYAGTVWEGNTTVRTFVFEGDVEHKDILANLDVINTILKEIDEDFQIQCKETNNLLHLGVGIIMFSAGLIVGCAAGIPIYVSCTKKRERNRSRSDNH